MHAIDSSSAAILERLRVRAGFLAALFALIAAVAFATTARAQATLYWDTNGTTAGFGSSPSGTWKNSGANLNWNSSAAGTNATTVWTPNSIAVFNAGTSSTVYTVTVSGTQSVDSIDVRTGLIDFTGGTIKLTGATPSITVANGLYTVIDSVLAGSGGLVVDANGGGILFLSNSGNNYTGATIVNSGTLGVDSLNNVLPSATALTIASGATFGVNPGGATTQTIGSLSGAGSLVLSDATLKVGDATSTTFSGVISDDGTNTGYIQKLGNGTLTLTGANTNSGKLQISAGVVVAGSSGALGTASTGNTISSGAALHISGNSSLSETDFSIVGTGSGGTGVIRNLSGTNSLAGTINLSGNSTITSSAGTLTLSGDIGMGSRNLTVNGSGNLDFSGATSGTGQIIKDGTGTVTLSGATANTNSGATSVNDGTLQLNKTAGVNALGNGVITVGDSVGAASSANLVLLAGNQIANNASVVLNSDGRLALNNFSETIDKISGTGLIDLATSGALTVGGANGSSTFGGSITGTGTLVKSGTGTLTFNSTISFGGTLDLSGGTIALSAIGLTVGTLHITGNTVLDFGNSTASTLNATTFLIDAGVTLTINNWVNAVDFFGVQNWAGVTPGTSGATPMNQITFTGNSSNSTHWQSYDNQVTPVPEPATYGAIFAVVSLGLVAWRRRQLLT